jgi:hypothetical protein
MHRLFLPFTINPGHTAHLKTPLRHPDNVDTGNRVMPFLSRHRVFRRIFLPLSRER